MRYYIGIDPGKSGGIAVVNSEGKLMSHETMPSTERDVLAVLYDWSPRRSDEMQSSAVLEFVRTMPEQGVVSAFTFGWGYGGLRMALLAMNIPFTEATPGKWQRALGCLSKGDKNVTKRRAQELFPNANRITHATADAILLAHYARWLHPTIQPSLT